jgi:predicted permease
MHFILRIHISDEAISAIALGFVGLIVWIFTWGWAAKLLFKQKNGWLIYATHFILAFTMLALLSIQRGSGLAGAIEALFYQLAGIAICLAWGIFLLLYAKRRAERLSQESKAN